MKPDAVIFDLFGTLLDIASLRVAAARYADDPAALVATWREKQLGYAFAATIMGQYEDFDALTLRALRYAAMRHGARMDAADIEALAAAWEQVSPYDDALAALTNVRARGVPCAILTNGTPATARAALASAHLADVIDTTLSVDAVRAYKPDTRVYALAVAHFATSADRLVFVTSNGWDATGAAAFGMRVAWCNRAQMPAETFGPPPAWQIRDLHELAAIIQ
jgi:2-haloacid dehalogenase